MKIEERLINQEGGNYQRTWWCLCNYCKGKFVCYEDRRAIRFVHNWTPEVHEVYRKIGALEHVVVKMIEELSKLTATQALSVPSENQ